MFQPLALERAIRRRVLALADTPRRRFWKLVLVGAGAAAAIVTAASMVRPIYLDQIPVAQAVLAIAPSVAEREAPWVRLPLSDALRTPQFLRDRDAFARDLVATGKVTEARARNLAEVAVREAYERKVPPALVFGVMTVENDLYKSTARSKVGALGLMQIHPPAWLRSLGPRFGTNLRNDATNLKYGVFILGYLAEKAMDPEDMEKSWRSALLRYNGCVRGTNTPNCFSYPDKVRDRVERMARTTCGDRDFEACVVQPLWLSRLDAAVARPAVGD